MIQSILALAALFLASLVAEAAPQVTVRSAVEVADQDAITFGDLAEFSGFAQGRAEQLKAIRVADAPGIGDQRVFTSFGLSQAFRSYIKGEENGEKVQFSIPSRVVVKRKSLKLNEGSVKEVLVDELKQLCPNCEVKIEKLSLPIVSNQSSIAKWKLNIRSELPRGNFSYPLEVRTEAGIQTYWITGLLSIRKHVLVSKRNIALGEKIEDSDIATELRDVTYFNDTAADASDLKSQVAARSIAAEQVIGRSFLKKENAFKFGETVQVVTGNNSWQISIDGIAQQAAAVGDVARVKIPRTQKIVSGVVVDKGVIEVR